MQKLIVALFGLLLAACSSSTPETPPTRVVIWLHAAPNLNPSAAGQAAPLRLRLYELKKDTAFGRADYFALTDNAQSTLGGDLVEQDEFLLRPGEERRIERTLDEQTRQLGFVAAYRDLDRATWRQVLAVPGQRTSHLDITLGAQAIGIVARPAP
ncbi:type VI secretion system lipoprotein TssJ [Pseudomonas aeruginosa]|uniref:type VI secretion system lipoprotein TssJ n=1 Tax=Pseudomonas aeruginosa TaxID=287 RepID=UPI0021493F0D|nr:type VI secretion system lipoprotein TssJ [Pseudomonas aeruginosa]MCQ9838389.1 type VI secretion system lipoprotein TssJ [Pseudomonas aeruginosa]MCQ9864856.1 type VI secretion system lipoprotein TssJ [Pseudomonas aeruginosa]